jgi:Tol biopolymer transport system component
VIGSNFVQDSQVQWNGTNLSTQFVSSTEVDATLPASDLAAVGVVSVLVVNPIGEGGNSNTVQFSINAAPIPGVSDLVSIAADNVHSGDGPSDAPSANLDGQWVAFESVSNPSNTLTTDTLPSGQSNIFLHKTCLGQDSTCVKGTALISRADPSFHAAPNNNSVTPAVSAGGRFVAFQSDATNLIPGGVNNGFPNIFRHDPVTGTTVLISQSTSHALPNNDSQVPAISASGRFVAFRSPATNLVSNVTGPNGDQIYLRDTCFEASAGCNPSTILVSAANDGTIGTGFNDAPSVSADGRFVAFESLSQVLVPGVGDGNNREIFLRDTCIEAAPPCTPSIKQISAGLNDGAAAHFSTTASVSGDGRYVAFETVPSPQGSNFHQVYVRDTCIGATVACTPSTTLVSVQLNNAASDGDSESPSISADGRYVAYVSTATKQVANDTNGFLDHFVRDTCIGAPAGCTSKTVRVSVTPSGTQTNHDDPIGILIAIAGNGQAAAFASSASNLVTNDNNGEIDVFLGVTGFSSPIAAPVILAVFPSSANQGDGDTVLTLLGDSRAGVQFVPGAQVLWNGLPRDTIFINDTMLKVFIPGADLVISGTAQLVVVNPDPGGQSPVFAFSIH